ncbi:hypothetical protein AMATHDRAFT_211 [Amanita thiersii Skay4041]|uniref:MIT domain-containing protein n=1 Tax=Amanita thiersii Skay4041 TaxID=703135 RepID=A0A2A9P1K0_9AGAR|nr:hypothetical protein AMATHDRAFT_211 [Amanita thiersii Skay4041]
MGFESRQEGSERVQSSIPVYNQHTQQSVLSSSPLSQRRRSLAYTRTPAPPPNFPIPNVPDQSQDGFLAHHPVSDTSDHPYSSVAAYVNGKVTRQVPYARPSASPNLASIATFSQNLNVLPSKQSLAANMTEDLSDPPPQSYLPSPPRVAERRRRPSGEDGLLSPTNAERRERPPSSRSALTRALELARQAVHLDSTNDNPAAAVEAYAHSVALLSQVMDRVRRGEDGGRRTRSPEAQEEEIRRLQNIHDTYADRMNILSIIYSIPVGPHGTSSIYSNTSSPTNSGSSSSHTSPQILQPINQNQNNSQFYPGGRIGQIHDIDSVDIMREAIFPIDDSPSAGPALHPYASPESVPDVAPSKIPGSNNRASTGPPTRGRPRAISNLPPTSPPAESLPPPPTSLAAETQVMGSERLGHRRNGSGRLARLDEKDEGHVDVRAPIAREPLEPGLLIPDTPRNIKRDSHPLPPIPHSEHDLAEAVGTIRVAKKSSASPKLSNSNLSQRPRAASQMQNRPDAPYINPSPKEGAIFLRRTQTSAPSSTRSSSPTDPGNIHTQKHSPSSLPTTTTPPPMTGRARSSSQPGRKPTGQISPSESRPPLPPSMGQNGTARKVPIPSKLNPNAPPASLTIQTDILSPIASTSMLQPTNLSNNIQTTPTSPLPPAPPSEPLRKPYHMMNLLLNTMTSATGGYVTRRLHVPFEVWSQGGAKLTNVPEKIRVVEILSSALEDLQTSSSEYFGAGNVSSGLALGIGSVGRKEAEGWLSKLDDFSGVCDGIEANLGKKLGVGEGFAQKKTALSGWAKKIDKFTNGKNLDSPTIYVQGLKVLFQHAQLLDEHTQAVISISPAYAAFPPDIRGSAEQKLKRSSEFFATVVLTFVIRDLSQLLDKYVKKCEKWLAE